MNWREEELIEAIYPGIATFSGRTILGDDVIGKLATCGEFMEDYSQLKRHVRWAYGQDSDDPEKPSQAGRLLLTRLEEIYAEIEATRKERVLAEYAQNIQDFVETGSTSNKDTATAGNSSGIGGSRGSTNLTVEDYQDK